jgi:hypothetical protein
MLDLSGKRFGKLLVKSRVEGKTKLGEPYKWLCICDCGKECTPRGPHLVRGASTSCGGCLWKYRAFRQILCEYKVCAKRRGIVWDLSEEEFRDLTSSPCHYTGVLPNKSRTLGVDTYVYNGIDRLDSNKGYTLENCVPCCSDVNYAKRTMEYSDFIKLCAEVINHVGKETHRHTSTPRKHHSERRQ